MSALSTLFEQFLRDRRYLKNETPKTVAWYQNALEALTRTVAVSARERPHEADTAGFRCAPARAWPLAGVV